MSQITNLGTDSTRVKTHSVRAVNKAIAAYAMAKGPMVEVVLPVPNNVFVSAEKFSAVRVTRVRVSGGEQQGKLLVTGKWMPIRGVLMQ